MRALRGFGLFLLGCLFAGASAIAAPPEDAPPPEAAAALARARRAQLETYPQQVLKEADAALSAAPVQHTAGWVVEARRLRAGALRSLGDPDAALSEWRTLETLANTRRDEQLAVVSAGNEALLLWQTDPQAGRKALDALLAKAAKSPDPLAASEGLTEIALLFWREHLGFPAMDLAVPALDLALKKAPDSPQVFRARIAQTLIGPAVLDYTRSNYQGGEANRWADARGGGLPLADVLDAQGLSTLGEFYRSIARRYFAKSLEIRQRETPLDPATIATLFYDYEAARGMESPETEALRTKLLALIDAAAASPERALPVTSRLIRMESESEDYSDQGFAQVVAEKAAALYEKLAANSLGHLEALSALSRLAVLRGDLAAADLWVQRASAVAEKAAPESLPAAEIQMLKMLSGLNRMGGLNLGILLGTLKPGIKPEALSELERDAQRGAARIQKLAPNSPKLAWIKIGLGVLELNRNDLAKSEAYVREALTYYESHDATADIQGYVLFGLAQIVRRRGNAQESAALMQRASKYLARINPNKVDKLIGLSFFQSSGALTGDPGDVERQALIAWQTACSESEVANGDEARQAFSKLFGPLCARLVGARLALGKTEAAFRALEEGRARSLRQTLAEREIDRRSVAPELLARYDKAITARGKSLQAAGDAAKAAKKAEDQLQSARERKPVASPEELDRLVKAVQTAKEQRDQADLAYNSDRVEADSLWGQIRQASPRRLPEIVSIERGRSALPAGSLYLCYSVGDEATHVFGFTSDPRQPLLAQSLPVKRADLAQLTAALRRAVTDPGSSVEDCVSAGKALAGKVIPEAFRPLLAASTRVFISPDGPLWDVPFAALPADPAALAAPEIHWLGCEKALTYTQSLSVLFNSRGPETAGNGALKALVVGDPQFAKGSGLTPLPGTRVESQEVARIYRTTPLTGPLATELAVRQAIQGADIVHLATHSRLDTSRSMASAVMLTPMRGKTEPGGEGALRAWEVFDQLKLRAKLVVLSACDTARGENVPGEGIIGLTRALQYAGAGSVVATHWEIADRSAVTAMTAFHQELGRGLDKDEALRLAMRRTQQQFKHPFHWAGFLLTGDPSPLTSRRN